MHMLAAMPPTRGLKRANTRSISPIADLADQPLLAGALDQQRLWLGTCCPQA
jgi:hypothetical protein